MNDEPKKGTASEEVQKPAELSAEELEKAAGGTPTDPCNKIEKALSEKELEQVTGGGESVSLNFTKIEYKYNIQDAKD